MISAFGVEHGNVSKLASNEFYHGTTVASAAAMKHGFRPADPKGKQRGERKDWTRAGRPRAGGTHGAAVYMTKSRTRAEAYAARTAHNFGGEPKVVLLSVPKGTKWLDDTKRPKKHEDQLELALKQRQKSRSGKYGHHGRDNGYTQISTARKLGYDGVKSKVGESPMYDYAYPNFRKVKLVGVA